MGMIRTRLAETQDRLPLIDFIRNHWAERHIFVTDPEVFDWQYLQPDGRVNMMLAEQVIDDGQTIVLGVLGFIPMGRFDSNLGDSDILLALWKVREDLAPPGLGLRLFKALQAQLKPRMIGAIGISDMVGPIYKALGYKLDHLLHAAIINPTFNAPSRLAKGVPAAAFHTNPSSTPRRMRRLEPQIDRPNIAKLLDNRCPQKSWTYIEERYLNHPWYKYDCRLVIKNDSVESLVIWRKVEINGQSVLRIVDVIGECCWLAQGSALFVPVLVESGAEYIDIMGCGLSVSDLQIGGFISPEWCDGLILPNYFSPYEARNIHIALSWKRFDNGNEPMRLFRADSDQDRPNQPTPKRNMTLKGKAQT